LFWPVLGALLLVAAYVLPVDGPYAVSPVSVMLAWSIVACGVFVRAADLGGLGARLGDASYSLYLTHMFTIRAGSLLAHKAGLAVPPGMLWFGLTSAAVLVSLVCFALVERPTLHFSRRWSPRRGSTLPTTTSIRLASKRPTTP
jgi:peptidoglycan/LPS O-acetylase OafA/YrhL